MAFKIVIFVCLFRAVFINGNKTVSQELPSDSWDDSEPFGQSQPSPDLRLPPYIVPSFYRLKLQADLESSNFTGEVYITIRANEPVKEIILHSKNLSINRDPKLTEQIYEKVETLSTRSKREINETLPLDGNSTSEANINNETLESETISTTLDINTNETQTVEPDSIVENVAENIERTSEAATKPIISSVDTQVTHSSVRNIKIVEIQEATGDRLILKLASALTTDAVYTLQLSFSGQISNALTGFYKSSYKTAQNEERKLGVTQFEPTSARAAFPCFDEPAFKAMFEISIAHPENITVLSNMKVSTEEDIPDQPGWKWTHFDRSVNMSTYLVAYVLCDFKSLETTYVSTDNVTKTIKVWARPDYIENARYALNITPKLLTYYEEVFGVPYALDKLDLIAVPDFSSGAMENWGLITFRETTLLFDEASGVPRDKQNVAVDVAHELAHQWFGNLVTMRWWTDLWLNEGFATYIEYLGVDHIEPEWNMLEAFTRDKMNLLRCDSLKNTSPVSRRVVDATEISQKFDAISYSKGANLIRMLNHTITEEVFHKGLLYYLKDWKYMNAVENDLWTAMSRATESDPAFKDLSMVDFMDTWTRQAGYPVVNVNRNYEKGLVEIEQRLFTSSSEPYQAMIDQLWHIPISYTSVDAPQQDWTSKPKFWLKDRFKVVSIPINSTEALYVNVDAIGYYRVNYDQRNWELVGQALRHGRVRAAAARAQLLDDAFNLAKASRLHYHYALGLTAYAMDAEDDKLVWEMLLYNMQFLKNNLRTTAGYSYFQDYIRMLLKKQLRKLNYGLDKPKDDNEAFLIENLLSWECSVESPRCLTWARNMFDKWMNNPEVNEIPSYLRSLVYNVALKHGGRREFDFLWDVFQNSTDPTVKSLIINILPSTRDEALITELLERSLCCIASQYAVAAWGVTARGAAAARRFLRAHFPRVLRAFTDIDAFMFPAVLSGAYGFIDHPDDLRELKTFATKYKQQLLPMSQTLQKLIDSATLRIDWIGKYAKPINDWFREYVTNSTKKSTNKVPNTDNSTVDNTSTTNTQNTSNSQVSPGPNAGGNSGPSSLTVNGDASVAAGPQTASGLNENSNGVQPSP